MLLTKMATKELQMLKISDDLFTQWIRNEMKTIAKSRKHNSAFYK